MTQEHERQWSRRTALQTGGAVLVSSLAGCTTGGDESPTEAAGQTPHNQTDQATTTETETETDTDMSTSESATGVWPMFHRDAGHSGYSPDIPSLRDPQFAWQFETENTKDDFPGTPICSPVVVNETVFAGAWDNKVYAFDAADGKVKWEVETDGEGRIEAPPAVYGDTVYVGNTDGYLYALNASDGSETWRTTGFTATREGEKQEIRLGAIGLITVANDRVYTVDASSDTMVAWATADGTRVWSRPLATTSPAVSDGTVYHGQIVRRCKNGKCHTETVSSGDPAAALYARNTADGSKKWQSPNLEEKLVSGVTVVENTVYAQSPTTLYAFNTADGSLKWTFSPDGGFEIYWTPSGAVANGTVYTATLYYLYALDAETGGVKWKFKKKRRNATNGLIVSDSIVYLSDRANAGVEGLIHGLDAKTGTKLWTVEKGEPSHNIYTPAADTNTIYVIAGDDDYWRLHALRD